MVETILDAFRLRGSERSVFQHLLQSGGGSASEIARRCAIPRNTTRGILDKLVSLGLLAKTTHGITQVYAIESEENILRSIDQTERNTLLELAERREAMRALDKLSWRQNSLVRPKITLHEGYRGLERVYEDTLNAKDGLRSWASFDVNRETLPRYFRSYYRRRAEQGIKMRSIHPDSPLARAYMKRNRKELRQAILLPPKSFSLTPEIQVYNNKVSIVSWREKIAVLIESEEISQAMRAIFDLSWSGAVKKKKNKN